MAAEAEEEVELMQFQQRDLKKQHRFLVTSVSGMGVTGLGSRSESAFA